jgi:hypothetical protein
MPELNTPVTPPTPAPTPASTPTPAPPATDPAAIADLANPPATPITKTYRAKGDKRESLSAALDRRFNEIQATEAAQRVQADKARAEALNPVAPVPPTAPVPPDATVPAPAASPASPTPTPALPTPPAPVDDSDATVAAEIAAKTKDMSAEAKSAFSKLQYEKRDLNRKLKDVEPRAAKATELETQLAANQKEIDSLRAQTAVDPEEVTRLKAELADAKSRDTEREQLLAAVKVESTDAFKNAITVPTQKIENQVKTLAKKYELSEAELMSALRDTTDQQSDKLLTASEKMNEIEKARFYQAAVDLQKFGEDAEVMRAQAKDALALISAKSTESATAKKQVDKTVFDAAHNTNWTKLKTLLPDILTPATSTDEVSVAWNKAQVDAEAFAKSTDFEALPIETRSEVLQRAAVFPLLAGALKSYEDQLAAEKAAHEVDLQKLEGFLKASPAPAPRSPAEPNAPTPADKETDFVKRVNARFAEAGL